MKSFSTSLILLYLFGLNSYGSEAGVFEMTLPEEKCTSTRELFKEINNCGDNEKAMRAAKACYSLTLKAWKKSFVRIQNVLSVKAKISSGQQSEEFAFSSSDYQKAENSLKRLMGFTQKNADLMAKYPQVMMDDPYLETESASLPCYSNVFKKIEKMVLDLDQKTQEAQKAKVLAKKFANGTQLNVSSTRSLANGGKIDSAKKVKSSDANGFFNNKSKISIRKQEQETSL